MHGPGVEVAIFRSLVRRPTTTLPSHPPVTQVGTSYGQSNHHNVPNYRRQYSICTQAARLSFGYGGALPCKLLATHSAVIKSLVASIIKSAERMRSVIKISGHVSENTFMNCCFVWCHWTASRRLQYRSGTYLGGPLRLPPLEMKKNW